MRKPLVITSIAVHALAVGGLMVASWWRIDKLPIDAGAGSVGSLIMPGNPGGSPKAASAKPKARAVEKVVVKVKDVQPRKVKAEPVVAEEVIEETGGEGEGDQTGNGTGNGKGNGVGDGPDDDGGGGDKPEPEPEPEPVVVKQPEPKVQPKVLKRSDSDALKVSGNENIQAPRAVKLQMVRDGKQRVTGNVKLCVGTDGRVATASVLGKGTGYDAYDDLLVEEMRRWRYHALVEGGTKRPFCTVINVIYLMRD